RSEYLGAEDISAFQRGGDQAIPGVSRALEGDGPCGYPCNEEQHEELDPRAHVAQEPIEVVPPELHTATSVAVPGQLDKGGPDKMIGSETDQADDTERDKHAEAFNKSELAERMKFFPENRVCAAWRPAEESPLARAPPSE